MLSIVPIKNVNNTLNRQIAFKAGVQSNGYTSLPYSAEPNFVERGLFQAFFGNKNKSAVPNSMVEQRAKTIEAGLNKENKRFDAIA